MKKNRNKVLAYSLFISLTAFAAVTAVDYFGALERAEWISYDWRMKSLRSDVSAPDDIAVILIDETSLANLNPIVGRWPWPRSIHADVLEFIASGEPRAIIVDILFSENEMRHGQSNILSENDQRLVEASENGITYHAAQIFSDSEDEVNRSLLNLAFPSYAQRFANPIVNQGNIELLNDNNKFYLPYPELTETSQGLGIVNVSPDNDGVFRRIPLLHRYKNHIFPTLGISPLVGKDHSTIDIDESHISIDNKKLPIDDEDAYWINFYGKVNSYSMSGVIASAQNLLAGNIENLIVDPYEFEDKIVFIGASAAGVEDLKATPLSNKTPGVMIHASTTGNLLKNEFLKPINQTYTLLICLILSIVTTLATMFNKHVIFKILTPVILVGLTIASAYYLFSINIVLTMTMPILSTLLASACAFTYLVFTEGRDKRKIRHMLAQYVSPAVLTEVVDSYEDHLSAEVGREQCLSILFSDIRGFTNLSEAVPPNQLVEMLNFYFSKMTDAVFEHDGTIDKFIGDAIMAFWGAPINDPLHAKKSVAAAIEMTKRLEEVNQWLRDQSYPEINIGIGINTGDVIIGNIGSDRKLDYTVIGDNVNLASRLEGLTKPYGCSIIISEYTYEQIEHSVPSYVVDLVRVKGKKRPIRVYAPVFNLEKHQAHKLVLSTEIAFQHYLDQKWQQAIDAYEKHPNSVLREIFVSRCKNYIEQPPESDWDGVHTMTSK